MIFYIIAIPAFSFFLPLYSFWRMDDFSWGQTRVVLGESGKKMIVHDEGKFDPRSIPLKSWSDYENELWDKESNHSIGSWVPSGKYKVDNYAESRAGSIYGRETYYEPRTQSPVGMAHPPGHLSGRDTPLSVSPHRAAFEVGTLYHPTPSRPATHDYLEMNIPTTGSPDILDVSAGAPPDRDLELAVQQILQTVDLSSVTKRDIRRKLEDRFGVDLTTRKAIINAVIDRMLLMRASQPQ
jgi:chitin synthase